MGKQGAPPPLPPLKLCSDVSLKICSGSGRSPENTHTHTKRWSLIIFKFLFLMLLIYDYELIRCNTDQ